MTNRYERIALWCGGLIVFALGAVLHWRYRFAINPDAVQYVDVARQIAAGHWSAAANPVWSPVYPLLVAMAMAPFPDRPDVWYVAAQMVGALCEIIVLLCLGRFVVAALAKRDAAASIPTASLIWSVWAAACLFLHYGSINRLMTPDLLVCACVLTIGTELLTPIEERHVAWGGRLGILLALGYYVKAILFPIAALVVAALLIAQGVRRNLRPAIVMTAVWLGLIAPLVAATSARAGHVTFGDSGRLVYDWWVNRGPFFPVGMPGRDGSTMVTSCSAPVGYAWIFPEQVTYPPFYEPSFWRAQYRVPLSLTAQLQSTRRIATELVASFFPALGLIVPAMALFAAGWRGAIRSRVFVAPALLGVALVAVYLPVHIEPRFITASMLLLTVSWLAGVAGPLQPTARHLALASWVGALLVVGLVTAGSLRNLYLTLAGTPRDERQIYHAAEELPSIGVLPGSRVAVIGNDLNLAWAQLAGLQVIAEVPNDKISGELAQNVAEQLVGCLSSAERPADAIISKLPLRGRIPGWQKLPLSGLAVYRP